MYADVDHQIIEIDESLFGKKRKYNRGTYHYQAWVFGLVQRYTRKVILKIVDQRTKVVLLPLIKKYVEPGSTIYHDDFKTYQNLDKEGYKHGVVNHSEEFMSEDGVCTNTIEGIWGDAKLRFRSMHGVIMENLQDYLDEYCYRFMYKDKFGSIYWKFMADAAIA